MLSVEALPAVSYRSPLPDFVVAPHSPEQTHIPEVTHFGKMAILSHPFGIKTTFDNLTKFNIIPERLAPLAQTIFDMNGIGTRYMSLADGQEQITNAVSLEETTGRAAYYGATLIKKVAEEQGWNRIGRLVVSSSFLPTDLPQRMEGFLKGGYSPIEIGSTFYCSTACAGGVVALAEAMKNETYRDENTVIVAAEPLSFFWPQLIESLHENQDNPEYAQQLLTVMSIFGDDYAAIAFKPSDFNVLHAKCEFLLDGGVIKIPTFTNPGNHQQDSLSARTYWNTKEPDGQTDHAGKRIFFNSNGILTLYENPENGDFPTMDGIRTAQFFRDASVVFLHNFRTELAEKGIDIEQITNMVFHMPSKKVIEHMVKNLNRGIKIGQKMNINVEFLLDRMQRSNSSSATVLAVLDYLVRNKQLDPNGRTFFYAPGVGATLAGLLIEPKN